MNEKTITVRPPKAPPVRVPAIHVIELDLGSARANARIPLETLARWVAITKVDAPVKVRFNDPFAPAIPIESPMLFRSYDVFFKELYVTNDTGEGEVVLLYGPRQTLAEPLG